MKQYKDPNDKLIHKIGVKLIPKWYKEKYSEQICNRKHSSGYWFDFIIPREIAHTQETKDTYMRLYRWFNFYIPRHYNQETCKHKHTISLDGKYTTQPDGSAHQFTHIYCKKCNKQIGSYLSFKLPHPQDDQESEFDIKLRKIDKALTIFTTLVLTLIILLVLFFAIAIHNMLIDHQCTVMPHEQAIQEPKCKPYIHK